MRRFTVEVMRRLDAAGIDSVLPDLPGCNESLQPLDRQEVSDWQGAIDVAARHFGATHALGIRGGCLLAPGGLPTWHYAPIKAASILRQMLRARILASREAGQQERRETLVEAARTNGIELVGYPLGAAFYCAFDALVPTIEGKVIEQERIGGAGLWLRAEPDENAEQADTLAAILATELHG